MVGNLNKNIVQRLGILSRNLYSDPHLDPHSRATSPAPPPLKKIGINF